jgi:hypothetical protein
MTLKVAIRTLPDILNPQQLVRKTSAMATETVPKPAFPYNSDV